MTQPGIEPKSLGPLANTLPIRHQQKKRELAKLWTLLSRLTTEYKRKKSEKKIKYLKKPWNMKGTFIPMVIGALGKSP